ncbi:MAG: BspA family leucine-rich repeat surface protein, partial [Coriobacteriales bacterium]
FLVVVLAISMNPALALAEPVGAPSGSQLEDRDSGSAAEAASGPSADAADLSADAANAGADAAENADSANYGPAQPQSAPESEALASVPSSMHADSLSGSAYAVFDSGSGTLTFVRSTETHSNGEAGTVKSVSGGEYTGTIYADFEDKSPVYYTKPPWSDQSANIVKAVFQDKISPLATCYWFANCGKLVSVEKPSNLDTSLVTNMCQMFSNCYSLTSLDVSSWSTGNVENFSDMFYGCYNLGSLDVSNWNTSSATDLSYMFLKCKELKSLDVSKWNTSSVTDISHMFDECTGLTSVDVSRWDTSKVTRMFGVFRYCSSLSTVDVSKWDTSSVKNMGLIFTGCQSLNSLDVSMWDTSKVENLNYAFSGCTSLTSLDLSKWDTQNLKSMEGLFASCRKIKAIDLSNFDTSEVTSLKNVFYDCEKVTKIDMSGWDTSKVTDMTSMFYYCASMQSFDLSPLDTGNVLNMSNMFSLCSEVRSLDLSSFDTSSVIDMSRMFYFCKNLESLDLSSFDTSKASVVNRAPLSASDGMMNMFSKDSSLKNVKLGEKFSFKGRDISETENMALFPTPDTSTGAYTGNWMRSDGTLARSAESLRDTYDGSTMSGTWVLEKGPVQHKSLVRLAGGNRYGTMAKIVDEQWESHSAKYIVLASGENFPDALSAGPLAGLLEAPLLTTSKGRLSFDALHEITRLKSDDGATVVIVGGEAAVSKNVADEVGSIDGITVERVSGSNRSGTAEAVYDYGANHGKWGSTAMVASGDNFPDALSASSYGYAANAPIFLACKGKVSATTVSKVRDGGFSQVMILGGASAVDSDSVKAAVNDPSVSYGVFAGSDRYETSALVCRWATGQAVDGISIQPSAVLDYYNTTFATGRGFADALASVSLAGPRKAPLLLVEDGEAANKTVQGVVAPNKDSISSPYLVGGTAVVSSAEEGRINGWMGL